MRLWNEAEQREALSLIYRAALAALIERFHCDLYAADTEGDCLVKARQMLTGTDIDYLGRLTRAWQLAAYAHVLPEEAEFADLCRCWPSVLVDLADEP